MSYDIYLSIDTGGAERAAIVEGRNYTSNVSPMWFTALGRPLRELNGMLAGDAIPLLEKAVAHMTDPANAEIYRRMNPPNGWGNHEGATEYLTWLLNECTRHPKATIEIWS